MGHRERILRDWYEEHYSTVAASANGSVAQRYPHRQMERRFGKGQTFSALLEVGGNRGEHVSFVRHSFERYVVSDLYLPDLLPEFRPDPRIEACQCDAAALPFPDSSFDRVISTCVLHHVDSPLDVIAEMRRVVKPGGWITLMIPTDPGLGYRLGVALTSARAARSQGLLDHMRLVKALDHRNHYRSIATQLRYACRRDDVRMTFLPGRLPSVELNMLTVWQIRRGSEAA